MKQLSKTHPKAVGKINLWYYILPEMLSPCKSESSHSCFLGIKTKKPKSKTEIVCMVIG